MLPLSEYIQITIGIMAIFSPFAAIPIFISLTSNNSIEERKQVVQMAAFAALIAGLVSLFLGKHVLEFFGITIHSFKIAGGILLLLMAINMLNAEVPKAKNTKKELEEAQKKSSNVKEIAVVPLAIPLIAGPGSISTIIIYSGQSAHLMHLVMMSGIILFCAIYIFVALRMATVISKKLGITGINIISRVMGLILASISVEFIISGLQTAFPILSAKGF